MMNLFGHQMELAFFEPAESPVEPQLDDRDRLEVHTRRIAGFLSMVLPDAVDVVLTDNRSTMMSYRHKRGRLSIRLHRMFRHADEGLLSALARYLENGSKPAGRQVDEFIALHKGEIILGKPTGRRAARLDPRGEHHDLSENFVRVCERYFDGPRDVTIGWGRRTATTRRTRRRRSGRVSRALATYSFADKSIRVNRVMDDPRVPVCVLDWLVYHELLHHVLPVKESGGRRQFHTSQFRALERAFDGYEEARSWETANLGWLLK